MKWELVNTQVWSIIFETEMTAKIGEIDKGKIANKVSSVRTVFFKT